MTAPERFLMEGDEALFSMGFAEEIWNLLVNVLGWRKLLWWNVASELALILSTCAVLTVVAYCDGSAADLEAAGQNVFERKLLLCLSTVRLATDAVFGWEDGFTSSNLEIFLLTVEGWLHWLLLNVFSAIIVARALRPRRSIV
jgi:hypothetical protein